MSMLSVFALFYLIKIVPKQSKRVMHLHATHGPVSLLNKSGFLIETVL